MENELTTVKELLETRFGIDFAGEARAYCACWPENLTPDIFPRGAGMFSVTAVQRVSASAFLCAETWRFPVDAGFTAELSARVSGGMLTRFARFYMRFFIDLERGRLIGKYISLTPLPEERSRISRIPLDQHLAPFLVKEGCDAAAEAIKNEYGAATPSALARAMGLDVKYADFADGVTLGRLFITGGKAVVRTPGGSADERYFPRGTMLVAKGRPSLINATIAHECCHEYLHRPFYLLQALAGTGESSPALRVSGPPRGGALYRLEVQCERLPGYIFLDEDRTREEMYAALERCGDLPPLKMLSRALNTVANAHGLPVSMVRNRLINIGFTSLRGISVYVDGRYIPDHLTSKKWPDGVTYTLGSAAASKLISSNAEFAARLMTGVYIYIEGHFCLNDRRFIGRSPSGAPALTPYAREHIDLCCLGFVRPRARLKRTTLPERFTGVAARAKPTRVNDRYMVSYQLYSMPDTAEYRRENAFFTEDSLLWGELEFSLPADFGKALTLIIDRLNVSRNSLANELGVDKKVVYRLLRNNRASLRHVVGACVALKLPYSVSLRLIAASGNALADDREHHLYRAFLLSARELTIDRCDDILTQNGYRRLFNSEM